MSDDSSSSSSAKSTPMSNNTLMLWTHHLGEPKNEIMDAGMMPPPTTTLPLNIRRTSLGNLLTAADQISPPILKCEIMDENSQGSIISNGPELMSHESMDHYGSENSLDGSNSAHTPEQLQNMTIMNSSPLGLLLQKNVEMTTAAFSTPMDQSEAVTLMDIDSTPLNCVNLRVKQEQEIAAQIQELVTNPSTTANTASLLTKINEIKAQVEATPLYTASTAATDNETDAMFANELANLNTAVNAITTTNQLNQNVYEAQVLMTEAGTAAAALNEILTYPSNTNAVAPRILSPSPPSTSPLASDVMLNAASAASISSGALIPSAVGTSSALSPLTINQPESDIILNPTISPTMMCTTTGDTNPLLNSQVTVGDPTILTVTLPTTTSQTNSAYFNNLMQPLTMKTNAVKNMILNAAADILSSEPNSINPETTMNALMSLNTAPLMTQENQPIPQPTTLAVTTANLTGGIVSMPNGTQQTTAGSVQPHHSYESQATQSLTNMLPSNTNTSSVVVLAGSNDLIQNVVAAATQSGTNIIPASNTSIVNSFVDSQMLANTATANATQNFLNNLQ